MIEVDANHEIDARAKCGSLLLGAAEKHAVTIPNIIKEVMQ